MSVLDDASKAKGNLTLPDGTKSVTLEGSNGVWQLVFKTDSEDVRINVPNMIRGLKLRERAQASLRRPAGER